MAIRNGANVNDWIGGLLTIRITQFQTDTKTVVYLVSPVRTSTKGTSVGYWQQYVRARLHRER